MTPGNCVIRCSQQLSVRPSVRRTKTKTEVRTSPWMGGLEHPARWEKDNDQGRMDADVDMGMESQSKASESV